jgi:hypothetical protein
VMSHCNRNELNNFVYMDRTRGPPNSTRRSANSILLTSCADNNISFHRDRVRGRLLRSSLSTPSTTASTASTVDFCNHKRQARQRVHLHTLYTVKKVISAGRPPASFNKISVQRSWATFSMAAAVSLSATTTCTGGYSTEEFRSHKVSLNSRAKGN